ncbi:MAG: response regulator, partial [Gammaproteobacteria bacterium]|nr:response regulator [Gammaproteobacteria bacterium]
INLQIACELLEKVPLALDTASDGAEAVAKVRANNYDCVLMDIQMPGMDGYTATGILREEYPFEELPILAMTANVMAEDRARTRDAGMNGHIAKPVDPADLYKALAEAIPEADYSANLPTGAPEGEQAPAATQLAPLPEYMPGLDIAQGLSRLANNEKLFLQLLADLLAEYSGSADTLRQLVAAKKMDEARAAAHKIRGIANNLGATDIGASAEAIERTVLDGEVVSDRQLEALSQALLVASQSHSELIKDRETAAAATVAIGVDVQAIFASLQAAVATFDPGATELIDQILAAQEEGSELAQQLSEARTLLDNFEFDKAEPLLALVEQGLQGQA